MNSTCLAFILTLALPALSLRQDSPSAYENCRFITSSDISDRKAPTFGAYHVEVSKPSDTKLDLKTNPIAMTYRTVLREEVTRGANFGGHNRLAVWGCGSSCSMFAVVNLASGRVITPQGFSTVSGVHLATDDFLSHSKHGFWGFRFRTDSSLLVVLGALDEDESREGAFYFLIDGEALRPIHSTVVTKDCAKFKR